MEMPLLWRDRGGHVVETGKHDRTPNRDRLGIAKTNAIAVAKKPGFCQDDWQATRGHIKNPGF